MSQIPQARDHASTNNKNNRGYIGHGSDNIVNSGNIHHLNITHITGTDAEGEGVELDRLLDGYTSKDALHNSYHSPPECYPGTRKTVRNVIGNWIDDNSSGKSSMLWLHGPAGVGKSVIAKTIAGFHDRVVATFFFSTSSDRSAATLFPTLAWQLARRVPETKQHIVAALKNNRSLLMGEIKEQFEHLIAQPLKRCTMMSTSFPVMVIDGIDECTDEYVLSRFLRVLVRTGERGDIPLRFIICSRPETRIRSVLKKINDHQETEWQHSVPYSLQRRSSIYWRRPRIWTQLLLPDIRNRLFIPIIWGFRNPTLLLQEAWKLYRPVPHSGDTGGPSPDICDNLYDIISPHPVISEIRIGFSEECKEDIARYLTDQFNELTGHQLAEPDISQLVNRSCGQFLYASTIVRLLEESHPKDVLEMARNSSLPTPDLNKLYSVILNRAKDGIRNRAQEGGPDYATELRILTDILTILIVLAENVHFFNVRENFAAIESLVGIEKHRLTKKLCKMYSVINVDPGVSISVYHPSFLEFLQSQKRSGEHYIAYPKALRRFLILMGRSGLRYLVLDWGGQLLDNDRKMREHVANLALACRRNYFKRSSSPATLMALHDLIHYFLPLIFLVPSCQFLLQLKETFIGAPTSSSAFSFTLEYLFLAFFCLLALSSGSFFISLTIYTLLFHQSLVLPLFYPFLHPYFVTVVGILLSSQQASLQSENCKTVCANSKQQGMKDTQEEQDVEQLETKGGARLSHQPVATSHHDWIYKARAHEGGHMSPYDTHVLVDRANDGVPFFSLGPDDPNQTPIPVKQLDAVSKRISVASKEAEKQEFREFVKQYIRTHMSGSGPMGKAEIRELHQFWKQYSHTGSAAEGPWLQSQCHASTSRRPHVASLPNTKSLVSVEYAQSPHKDEDLRSFEAAVLARKTPTKLSLRPRARRNNTLSTSSPSTSLTRRTFSQANNSLRQASPPERIFLQASDFTKQASSPERTFSQVNKVDWRVILSNRSKGKATPSYHEIDRRGPEHFLVFTYEVQINGTCWGKGSGTSKSNAMDAAAQMAVRYGDETGSFLLL